MTAESSGINSPIIPVDLENAIRNRRCILLVGCGLSGQIQIEDRSPPPTWRESLERIVEWCVGKELIREPEEEEAIFTLIDEGQLSDAGKKLEDDYLSDKLLRWECLNQILLHEAVLKQPTISRLHDLVVQIPFRAYFTTNYDTFLEQAFLNSQKYSLARHHEGSIADAVKAYGEYFESKQPFILKLHGDVKKPDALLLGDRDFKRLREDAHSPYRSGLKQLLLASSVLCIGFEKTDRDLEYLLAEAGIENKTHINRRNRYWSLVVQAEQSGGDDIQDKRIEIISCQREEVVGFFKRLLASLQPRSGQEARSESNGGGSGTDRIRRDRPQPEQAVYPQDGSSLNSTNSTSKFVNIYVSYDEADRELWEKLDKQLESMSMKEWIAVQNKNKVEPGKDEKTEIRKLISGADIILFMVSPNFTTSEMCQYEVEEAMKRHSELCIIPIYLRPVDWKGKPYGNLKSLPRDGTSVNEAKDKDKAFNGIAMAIGKVVDELRQLQKSQ